MTDAIDGWPHGGTAGGMAGARVLPAPPRPADSAAQSGLPLCGEVLVPDVSGALWWPAARTLIVADLHLEKGSSHAGRGVMLPPYDTAATLDRLAAVMRRFAPRRVVALGDSFHDTGAGSRIAPADLDRLATLQAAVDWTWIAGNHDPAPPRGVGGAWHCEVAIGPLVFRHEPVAGAQGEIAGHLHPVARVRLKGHVMRRRCFASDAARVVMPAFGAFTGGLNVRDAAYAALFAGQGFAAWMLGARGVYRIGSARLLA